MRSNFSSQKLRILLAAFLLSGGMLGSIALASGRKQTALPSAFPSPFPSTLPTKALENASEPAAFTAGTAVSAKPVPELFPEEPSAAEQIQKWCAELKKEIIPFKWQVDACNGIHWKIGGHSVKGRPLVYADFGDPASPNTTVIISAVHGDEITPLFLGLRMAQWLKENEKKLGKTRVVVAPLVNPDGFFIHPRTRTNARGVDCNRNLATRDWRARAVAAWKIKFASDPRRNPGREPHSEPETLFQEELIRRVHPQKVLSVHSPLNFLDYDGPTQLSLNRFSREYVNECLKLRNRLKAISGGFFPGSLGNFAGQELGIPTMTLELPTADPAKAQRYWDVFSKGIQVMIDFVVPRGTA